MPSPPLVSVVTPCRYAGPMPEPALLSLIGRSYPHPEDHRRWAWWPERRCHLRSSACGAAIEADARAGLRRTPLHLALILADGGVAIFATPDRFRLAGLLAETAAD